jgi:hypothetical protein
MCAEGETQIKIPAMIFLLLMLHNHKDLKVVQGFRPNSSMTSPSFLSMEIRNWGKD